MIVLVAYATVEGHTREIAGHIAERVESAGHEAILADLGQPGFAVPGRFDAIILCGPIHIGHYPSALVGFVQNWKHALNQVPTALVTVSLAIASDNENERAEARTYPEKLQEQTGWLPDARHDAAGALKYVEYDFFKRWVMRRISAAEGGPVDTSRDHVLTDWNGLDEFVDGFLSGAKGE